MVYDCLSGGNKKIEAVKYSDMYQIEMVGANSTCTFDGKYLKRDFHPRFFNDKKEWFDYVRSVEEEDNKPKQKRYRVKSADKIVQWFIDHGGKLCEDGLSFSESGEGETFTPEMFYYCEKELLRPSKNDSGYINSFDWHWHPEWLEEITEE